MPLLIILMVEMSGCSESFVESSVNEKGINHEYGSQVTLSLMSTVNPAVSPNKSGDFDETFMVISWRFTKCCAISLILSRERFTSLVTSCWVVGVGCCTGSGVGSCIWVPVCCAIGSVGAVCTGVVDGTSWVGDTDDHGETGGFGCRDVSVSGNVPVLVTAPVSV